jgi:hypothetical protein
MSNLLSSQINRLKVRISGDGTPSGTNVYDWVTGDCIPHVKSIMFVSNITVNNFPYLLGEIVIITGVNQDEDAEIDEEVIPVDIAEITIRRS